MGFTIPEKRNERRRCLLPRDICRIGNPNHLYFEAGFGEVLGVSDSEYVAAGTNVCSRAEVLAQSIVCSMKAPRFDHEEWALQPGRSVFGWIHAVQNREIVDRLVDHRLTAIAWEDMYRDGRHVFSANNEIAGQAAIAHAALCWGKSLHGIEAAVIGRGNTARGAFAALVQAGARVRVYDRKTSGLLASEIGRYDLIANAVLWDIFRDDHLVSRDDLARMKPGAMIVDISCDEGLGIETSRPTSIDDPVYEVDGVLHYAVDHTPTLLAKTASESISEAIAEYVDELVNERPGECLQRATIIERGEILDPRIIAFQGR